VRHGVRFLGESVLAVAPALPTRPCPPAGSPTRAGSRPRRSRERSRLPPTCAVFCTMRSGRRATAHSRSRRQRTGSRRAAPARRAGGSIPRQPGGEPRQPDAGAGIRRHLRAHLPCRDHAASGACPRRGAAPPPRADRGAVLALWASSGRTRTSSCFRSRCAGCSSRRCAWGSPGRTRRSGCSTSSRRRWTRCSPRAPT